MRSGHADSFGGREQGDRPTRRGYPADALRTEGRKDDHVAFVPGAAKSGTDVQVRDGLNQATGYVDLLQLSCGIESDIAAIGGPERRRKKLGFRSLQRPGLE